MLAPLLDPCYKMLRMEFVWVVPRARLFPEAAFHGYLPLHPAEHESNFLAVARAEGFFQERRYAETHPEFKQIIPYVIVRRGRELLCLTRLQTQSEKRLHGRRSIGVGGHINPCDAPAQPGEDLFRNACVRELREELELPPGALPLTPLGLLNDDSTDVGAVHVGLVYRLDAEDLPVAIRETSAMTGRFEPLHALEAAAAAADSAFESWSALLLRSGALARLDAPHSSIPIPTSAYPAEATEPWFVPQTTRNLPRSSKSSRA
ncbi:MAG: hypothetical protein EYC70_00205 [Planctomycetota bacterium]|nr:MAG: hypothetical protein EYC70_00205 [Planctomycetota bacterium]